MYSRQCLLRLRAGIAKASASNAMHHRFSGYNTIVLEGNAVLCAKAAVLITTRATCGSCLVDFDALQSLAFATATYVYYIVLHMLTDVVQLSVSSICSGTQVLWLHRKHTLTVV
jgi:hypothetical protein